MIFNSILSFYYTKYNRMDVIFYPFLFACPFQLWCFSPDNLLSCSSCRVAQFRPVVWQPTWLLCLTNTPGTSMLLKWVSWRILFTSVIQDFGIVPVPRGGVPSTMYVTEEREPGRLQLGENLHSHRYLGLQCFACAVVVEIYQSVRQYLLKSQWDERVLQW